MQTRQEAAQKMIDTPTYKGDDRRQATREPGAGRRADDLHHATHLEGVVDKAIREALASVKLVDAETHERHHDYIEAVLQRESDRAAFRKAIVEKGTVTLVWMAFAWAVSTTWQQAARFVTEHWK